MLTVGAFLEKHRDFEFDLEEYLLAARRSQDLTARIAAYRLQLETASSPDAAASTILAELPALARRIPAYSDYSGRSFAALPFIDKESIRRNPGAFVDLPETGTAWVKQTSGTTGTPVAIHYAPLFYFEILVLVVRKVLVIADLDDYAASDVLCIAATDNDTCRDLVFSDPTEGAGLSLQVVIDERDRDSMVRLASLIDELRPYCLTLKPSILETLLHHNRVPDWRPLIISGGSSLSPELRAKAEEKLGTRILNTYGLTELGLVASECRARNGLHVASSTLVVEVIRDGGTVAWDGDGELVLSSTANEYMPLVRYRTGDRASVSREPCICGLATARLTRLNGRVMRSFHLPSGALFSPAHFNDLFDRFPLREFQLTQVGAGAFRLAIEYGDGWRDEHTPHLVHLVRERFGEPVDVVCEPMRFSRDSKFERYRIAM